MALADMTGGTKRVRNLIQTFKQLAKPEGTMVSLVDLANVARSAIDDTRCVWEPVAEIRTDVSEDMPPVPCQIDQIRQVLHHLIVNAAHAIEDREPGEPGLISIDLINDHRQVRLEIEDKGCGMPKDHLDRIYDVLFATKEPSRGSGQGLALSQNVRHPRPWRPDHRPFRGWQRRTRFTITLPLADDRPNGACCDEASLKPANDKATVSA